MDRTDLVQCDMMSPFAYSLLLMCNMGQYDMTLSFTYSVLLRCIVAHGSV